MFKQSASATPGAHSWGAVFAMAATLAGVLAPMIPPAYQPWVQAGIAAIGAAAVKLP